MRRLPVLAGTLALASAVATPARAQHTHDAHGAHVGVGAGTELRAELEAVRAATARYRDHARAVADGYRRFGHDGPLMGEHWYLPGQAGAPLDLARPGTLQYAVVDGRRVLVGVAFGVYQRPGEPPPEGFAGTTDHWHTHDVPALARALTTDRPVLHRVAERLIRRDRIGPGGGRTQLTMLHAWVWSDNPEGVFAMEHRGLPYLRAGLPVEYARGASRDAALGVSLLAPGACSSATAPSGLVRPAREQRLALRRACDAAATRVRAARAAGPARLNREAERAWRDYLRAAERVLTPEQKSRVRAIAATTRMHEGMH